jgi:hypothetical protein
MLDNEIGTNKETSGIYQATDKEIKSVYNSLRPKEERRKEVEQQVKEYDCTDGSQLAKALNLVNSNSGLFDKAAARVVLSDQISEYRQETNSYKLKDGRTVIFADNTPRNRSHHIVGAVKIINSDGTVETYDAKGEKFKTPWL